MLSCGSETRGLRIPDSGDPKNLNRLGPAKGGVKL